MRDYEQEIKSRVEFIRRCVAEAGAGGVVFENSGGKDSALVGILCKKACPNTLGVLLPCQSRRNYGSDTDDALALGRAFDIECVTVDLSLMKTALTGALDAGGITLPPDSMASANIAPRLRTAAVYAIGNLRNMLVAGTSNRSELYTGYFTKWGDAHDFNPIGDLTVTEVYEFLRYLSAPAGIIEKTPSAGLYEGQTDEGQMGVTYAEIDRYLLDGIAGPSIDRIRSMNRATEHKRRLPPIYGTEGC